MNPKIVLEERCRTMGIPVEELQFPDRELEPARIQVVMISEVPPRNRDDYFYSRTPHPDYMATTLPLFQNAGVDVHSIDDILSLGIYITTAVKTPKDSYTVDTKKIIDQLPLLQAELEMFPNLKVLMLMGDVAKKTVNLLHRAQTKRSLIPAESTYKIRGNEYYWGSVRVFPSYIITGGNILIEKSKCTMITDDIRRMMDIIGPQCAQ